jgi:hypothetical protein
MIWNASPTRRLFVALVGIFASFVLLRPQISAALVVRGDDLLYRSDEGRALSFYKRALTVDADDAVAADRFVFVEMLEHRRDGLNAAVRVADAFLERHQEDATLLMDRGLCEHLLRRDRAAEEDFVASGRFAHDPRPLVFAGYEALRLGYRQSARSLWREAVSYGRHYAPALLALRRH